MTAHAQQKKFRWLAMLALLIGSCAVVAVAEKIHSQQPASESSPATPTTGPTAEDLSTTGTETLVFLRHGEKPSREIGQLNPQGLNRALALSKLLPAKYGKPDYLFAPDPAGEIGGGSSRYFYIRPLATIEPTAILLDMPVQTPFGFTQIDELNAELTSPKYARAVIFIAWEHGAEERAVGKLMNQFGADAKLIPHWRGPDFDSLYVLRIVRTAGRPTRISFTHDQEGLDHLGVEMPLPSSR